MFVMTVPKSAYGMGYKCQMDKLVRYQLWTIPEKKSSEEYFKISGKTFQKFFGEKYAIFFKQLSSSDNDLAEYCGKKLLEEAHFWIWDMYSSLAE